MGHLRERYNAKGRQSSTNRAKKRTKHGVSTTEPTYEQAASKDPVVLEVKSKEQKELDRRERLRLEVCRWTFSKGSQIERSEGFRTAEQFEVNVEEEETAREVYRTS